jgi:DNA helicase II / ATP-dependent DNA helicase PcrA
MVMMELDDLNSEQLTAVKHTDGPMLVVAGAGTGKTQVITRRIAYLIEQRLAKPEEILALTFTDKAAGEMLDRLDGLIGWQAYRVSVSTFNAFGGQLLQKYGHHAGFSTRTEVIPAAMKAVLLRRHLSEVSLSYYGAQDDLIDFLQTAVSYIEGLQNSGVGLEEFSSFVSALASTKDTHMLDAAEAEDRLKLYQLYESLKRRYGLIDYNDQITLPLTLLQQRPNIAERLRKQYRYVMVDEYQDTNAVQDALLKAFVPPRGNIFAVGDDDQAVYGFRGARLSNILEFAEYYKVGRPMVLTRNYRSTQPILDSAYKLIRNNDPDRLEAKLGLNKRLVGREGGSAPRFVAYSRQTDEQEGLAQELKHRTQSGQPATGMAVLATSHAPLQAMARVLRRVGVPFSMSAAINVFEHAELLQLWHLLKWVNFQANDEAVIQLLLGPFIGWSPVQVRRVNDEARKSLLSIEEVIEQNRVSDAACRSLSDRLTDWRGWARTMPPSQMVYKMIFESELKDKWVKQAEVAPRRIQRLFEDLQLWLAHMQQFEALLLPTLASYFENFSKPPEIEAHSVVGDENGVALLTVHAAKGLEFESVFMINNTSEAWTDASHRKEEVPSELKRESLELSPEHEKRRLMYVAMTRAKQELVLSSAVVRADGRARRLSPYLAEIFDPKELLPQKLDVTSGLEVVMQKIQRSAPLLNQEGSYTLPFETATGWLELSVTDIDKYDRCPYEFFLERVLQIRSPVGPQVQFGSLLHGMFHEYYRARLDDDPLRIEDLQQRLSDRWTKQGYRGEEEAQVDFDRAKSTLDSFYEREERLMRNVKATEQAFRLEIPDAKLRISGQIDLCIETDGGIEIRDFKTGRQRDPEKIAQNAKDSLQLRTYALVAAEMYGHAPARVVLDYVVTGVEGAAILSPIVMRNHRRKLIEIAEKIREKHFNPKSGLSHQCLSQRYWGSGEDDEELQGSELIDAG